MKNETAFAVQPRSWERLDPHGCDWLPNDMELAEAVAALWGEPCTIWACPGQGEPYRLKWA